MNQQMQSPIRTVASVATLIAVCFLLFPATGFAEKGKKDLDAVLGEIDWGDSRATVLKKMKQQMFAKLRKNKELRHDRVKMQQARKRMVEKYKRIKETYTPLSGDRTGYEVSVIAGEYTKNNGEALLKINDRVAQRFFLFLDGEFYKMVVAYRESYLNDVGIKAFVGQVAKKYGQPDGTDYGKVAGEKTLVEATWKDPTTILKAKNKKEFFGTYAMVFTDRKRVKELKANNKDFGGSDKDKSEISSTVQRLKKDSGEDANADVVDGMIGESIDVDLKRDKPLDKQGPAGKASKVKQDKGSSSAQTASKSTGGGGGSDESDEPEKDRDFSNLSTGSDKEEGGDDELIVY